MVFWKSSGWSEWALDCSAEYLLLNLHWAPSVMICEITSCCYGPYSKGFNDTSSKNPREAVQIEFLSENTCKHMLRKVKETPLFFLNICLIPTTRQHQLFYKVLSRSLSSIRGLSSTSERFYQELTDKQIISHIQAHGRIPAHSGSVPAAVASA